jgi:hypothetical protein
MAVADNLRILEPVFLLENRHKLANGVKLGKGYGLIVITYHFDPDRMVVTLLSPAPHRPSGMERLAVSVHDSVCDPFLIDAVVGLASLREFIQ